MATVKQLYDLLDRKAPSRPRWTLTTPVSWWAGGPYRHPGAGGLDITPEVIAEAAERTASSSWPTTR